MKKVLFTCLAVAMFDGRLEAMDRSSVACGSKSIWDAYASELRELADQSQGIQKQLADIDKQVQESVQTGLAQGQQDRTDSEIQFNAFSQVGSLIELQKFLPDGSAKDLLGRANDLIEAFHKFEERDHLKEEIARIPSEVQRIRTENARLEEELNGVNRLIEERRLVIDDLRPHVEPIDRSIAKIREDLDEIRLRIQKVREATDFNKGVLHQFEENLQRVRKFFDQHMSVFSSCADFLNSDRIEVPDDILEEVDKIRSWGAGDIECRYIEWPDGGQVSSCVLSGWDSRRRVGYGLGGSNYDYCDRTRQQLLKSIEDLKSVEASVGSGSSKKTSQTLVKMRSVSEEAVKMPVVKITDGLGWKMVEGLESLRTGNAIPEQLSVAWGESEKLDEELSIVRGQYKELSIQLSEIQKQNTDLNARLCAMRSELEKWPEAEVLVQSKKAQAEELLRDITEIQSEVKEAEGDYYEILYPIQDFSRYRLMGIKRVFDEDWKWLPGYREKAMLFYVAVRCLGPFKVSLKDINKYPRDVGYFKEKALSYLNEIMEALSQSESK